MDKLKEQILASDKVELFDDNTGVMVYSVEVPKRLPGFFIGKAWYESCITYESHEFLTYDKAYKICREYGTDYPIKLPMSIDTFVEISKNEGITDISELL